MKAKNATVGTVVKIKRSSKWYDGGQNNPTDTTGTIRSFDLEASTAGDFSVRVDWGSGISNIYRLEDLKVVKE